MTAGSEIESYCTKCRLLLDHVIVAMVGDTPKKVECLTCHNQHAYRAKAPENKSKTRSEKDADSAHKEGTTRGKQKTTKKTQKKTDHLYTQLLEGKDLSSAKPYSMNGSYEIDDVINHKRFGSGIIIEVIPINKMKVLFKEGYKFLVCNKAK
ncbi:MAG: hypothetical protein ACMUJM_01815 [bacterium]